MASSRRGPVDSAARTLKAALIGKVQPGGPTPLNEGLHAAIQQVESFLSSSSSAKSQADLQRLKADVKRRMLGAIQVSLPTSGHSSPTALSPLAASPSPSSSSPGSWPSSSAALVPSTSGRDQRAGQAGGQDVPLGRARDAHSSLSFMMGDSRSSVGGGGAGGSGRLDGSSGRLDGSTGRLDGGSSIRLDFSSLTKPGQLRASSCSPRTRAGDWSMPQRLLNQFAHLTHSDYDKMILVQDDLAIKAEKLERAGRRVREVQKVVDLDMQMLEHKERAAEEARGRRRELEAVAVSVQQYRDDEVKHQQRERQKMVTTRLLFDGQVQEAQERRRLEAEMLARQKEVERLELAGVQREAQLFKEQRRARNLELHDMRAADLEVSKAARAAARAARLLDERKFSEEAVRVMDAQEEGRRAAVQKRKDYIKRAFELGGGDALQMSLEEAAAADAVRAAQATAAFNAAADERQRRKVLKNEAHVRDIDVTIKIQLAEHKAVRAAEAAEGLDDKRRVGLVVDAEARRIADAKAERRAGMAVELQLQKAAALEEHRRRCEEQHDAKLADGWLHKRQLEGTQRGFANLAVPAQMPAQLLAGS